MCSLNIKRYVQKTIKYRIFRCLYVFCLFFSFNININAQINIEHMINVGRNALYYHDYVLSIQYFNSVIDARPTLFLPFYYRALAKFNLEDYDGAVVDCTKSIDLNPYYPDTYRVRALSYINQKKYKEATFDYKDLIKIDSEDPKSWQNLVCCFIEIDSINIADSTLIYMSKKWPDYVDSYIIRAQLMIQKNDTANARILIDKALSYEKYNIKALTAKYKMLLSNNSYKDAELILNEVIRLQPRNTHNLINRALCRYNLNNYRGAMQDYNLAIEIDPTNFIGRYNRGLLLADVGEDNKAIKDFDYILSIDPDDIMTIFNRARLLDQTGDYKNAIRDYSRVISEFPKFIQGYKLRAVARRKIGDIKGALRDEEHIFRESIALQYGYATSTNILKNKTRKKSQINPEEYSQLVTEDEDLDLNYNDEFRGKIQNKVFEIKILPILYVSNSDSSTDDGLINNYVLQANGLNATTIDIFKKGIDYCVTADDQRLSINKSNLSTDKNYISALYSQAEECFSLVINAAPNFAEAYYNRAVVREMQGRLFDANIDFDKAIKLKPSFARALFNRGINYYNQGNKELAIRNLSKAGELGIYQSYSILKQLNKK